MAWLRSEQSLASHPKTKRAARTLSISIPEMIGHLHCLWYWALDYAQDGDISGYEPWELAEAAMFDGDPDAFIHALLTCGRDRVGFIEETDAGMAIHDWYEYAGRLIEQREANAERMRQKRAANVQDTCDTRTGATNEEDGEDEDERTNGDGRTDVDAPLAGSLLAFAVENLPESESTVMDYRRVLKRHEIRLPRGQIERIVCELAEWKPKKPRAQLHMTLNKWLAKEQPEKRPQERPQPAPLKPIPAMTEEQREEQAEQARKAMQMVSGLAAAKGMP